MTGMNDFYKKFSCNITTLFGNYSILWKFKKSSAVGLQYYQVNISRIFIENLNNTCN